MWWNVWEVGGSGMLHRWINCEHFWFQFGLPTLGLQDLERCPGLLVLCELALRRRNARSSCWNYELRGLGSWEVRGLESVFWDAALNLTCCCQSGNILPLLMKMFYFYLQLANNVAKNSETQQNPPPKKPTEAFWKWLLNSAHFIDSWVKHCDKENVVFPSLRKERQANKLKYRRRLPSSMFSCLCVSLPSSHYCHFSCPDLRLFFLLE